MHSTYLDNLDNLAEATIKRYNDLKIQRPVYYINNILAEWTLDVEGRIYNGFRVISEMRERGQIWYGLDFSYGGGDSTAMVEINYVDGEYYCRELFCINTQRIGDTFDNMIKAGVPLDAEIFADSAMPLLVTELKDMGYEGIKKAKKGDLAPSLKLFDKKRVIIVCETKKSGLYKAYMTWKYDKKGKLTHEPDSLAACRYGVLSKQVTGFQGIRRGRAPRRISKNVGFM